MSNQEKTRRKPTLEANNEKDKALLQSYKAFLQRLDSHVRSYREDLDGKMIEFVCTIVCERLEAAAKKGFNRILLPHDFIANEMGEFGETHPDHRENMTGAFCRAIARCNNKAFSVKVDSEFVILSWWV